MSKNRPMMRTVSFGHHLLVGFAIAVMTALAGFGVIGAGDESLLRPERFDAKQVTVSPDGGDGVRIREVVDIDFGVMKRRGFERLIPNDFGAPTDITVESLDANADLDVVVIGENTRIRVGDPDIRFTGRHRYVLQYRLPEARVSSGRLDLDIVGNNEPLETRRFEVVLTGFQFDSIVCSRGAFDTVGGCAFEADESGNLTAVIEPVKPGTGITVEGAISALVPPVAITIPEPAAAAPAGFRPLGRDVATAGVAAAALVYVIGLLMGSNVVRAGGASEAAFGDARPSGRSRRSRRPDRSTSKIADARLAAQAATDFVPPRDLRPWQAVVVLRERVDDDSMAAWFSEMIAAGAIVATQHGRKVRLDAGEQTEQLGPRDRKHVRRLFAQGEIELGKRNKAFATTWSKLGREQRTFATQCGWWSRGGPDTWTATPIRPVAIVLRVLVLAGLIGGIVAVAIRQEFWPMAASPQMALVVGTAVPLVIAADAYRSMFAARSATGSAAAIRVESFRKFLVASEGRHVEWAWTKGLVREYTAWAVALGAAKAWSKAVKASGIPEARVACDAPLLVYSSSSKFRLAGSERSSSSGGGSGGSSGGGGRSQSRGVGSGGGGGSSGSW